MELYVQYIFDEDNQTRAEINNNRLSSIYFGDFCAHLVNVRNKINVL